MKTKKKSVDPHAARFSAHIFGPNSKEGGGHDSILHTILAFLSITGIPKGGHGTMPP